MSNSFRAPSVPRQHLKPTDFDDTVMAIRPLSAAALDAPFAKRLEYPAYVDLLKSTGATVVEVTTRGTRDSTRS